MRVATIPVGKTILEEPDEQDEEVSKAVAHLLTTSGIEAKTGPWHPMGMALPLDVPTVLDVVGLVVEVAGAVAVGGGYAKRYIAAKRRENALRHTPSMGLQIEARRDCTVTMRQLAYLLPAIYDVVNDVRPGVLLRTALICPDPPVPQCEIHLENVPVTEDVRDSIVARLKPEGSQARAIRQMVGPGRGSSIDITTSTGPATRAERRGHIRPIITARGATVSLGGWCADVHYR